MCIWKEESLWCWGFSDICGEWNCFLLLIKNVFLQTEAQRGKNTFSQLGNMVCFKPFLRKHWLTATSPIWTSKTAVVFTLHAAAPHVEELYFHETRQSRNEKISEGKMRSQWGRKTGGRECKKLGWGEEKGCWLTGGAGSHKVCALFYQQST